MSIAWSFLSPEYQAQLLHFRPELQLEHDLAMGTTSRCPRPNCGGVLVKNYGEIQCDRCSQYFDEYGNEIKPVVGSGRAIPGGFRH